MALQPTGLMSQTSGARPIRSQILQDIRNALLGNIAQPDLSAQLEALSDGQRQHVLQMAKLIRSGGNGNKSWRDAIRSMYPRMQDTQAQIIAALLEDIDPVDPASIQLELDLPEPAQNQWEGLPPIESLIGAEPYTYTPKPRDLPIIDRREQVAQIATTPSAEPNGQDAFLSSITPAAKQVAQELGIDPRIILAQAALETGYGKAVKGNNLFGIKSHGKADGLMVATHEVINGKSVPVTDSFRQYDTLEDSVKDYGAFLKSNPRYAEMLKAQDLDQQIIKLGQSGYATDPEYADKIASIAKGKRIGGLL